ncbi:MAG: alcohol dehydrogenase catalytic domain-containing protein [Candidatus Hatepunaea meridiana]|nr:alcohol dehydrogenase catalytic domain-containing protein [Candidatus Hatepunaea meridiana]
MKALRFKDKRTILQNITLPSLPIDEALIKVVLAGICNTDLEIIKGYMGFEGTLGHEFVGIVAECPSKPEFIGQRVVGEINAACGNCELCQQGLGRHCSDRAVLGILGRDGAFAEYLHLPVTNLHIVPDSISDQDAVFVEPLAAAFEITEQVRLRSEDTVLVIGDGKLAQLIVRVLALYGCRIDVAGISETKIRRMKDIPSRVYLNNNPPQLTYSIVIEASGSPSGWETAVNSVATRGTIILKSTYAGKFNLNLAPLVINEITVIGSRCGPFSTALSALEDRITISDLIDFEYPLDEWRDAFTKAREPETLKVVLRIGDA